MQNEKSREKLRQQLIAWDQLIKQGKAATVFPILTKLNHKAVARDQLLECAQIARRILAPHLIVSWYSPIIRSEKVLDEPPTISEQAIYALGLFNLGSFVEAEKILLSLDPAADPQIRFYRASLYMNQWLYRKAIPELKKYIQDSRTAPYSKLVGRLNLCASLVSEERFKSAASEITKLLKVLKRERLTLLLGNLLEIQAQLCMRTGRWPQAMQHLQEASENLQTTDLRSQIYVRKWIAVNNLSENLRQGTRPEKMFDELEQVKHAAVQAEDWESVRDSDLQRALLTKDKNLLLRIYWGSIFPAYKKRALKFLDPSLQRPRQFIWQHGHAKKDSPAVDLVQLAPSPTLQKLFYVLTREFYRPLRITEIFERVYKDDYYHPQTGPTKLRQLVARARSWLKQMNFPLEIQTFENSFKLVFKDRFALLLNQELPSTDLPDIPADLQRADHFTSADWVRLHDVSPRSARRQLHNLVEHGKIQSFFRGPKTYYKLRAA